MDDIKIGKNNRPMVSVCIPTYNRAEMLKECVEGILNQNFFDFELVISDNASEDFTEYFVKSINDNRIRYYKNSSNLGIKENFNRCLALAHGEYVTIIPDDDIMLPFNLQKKVEVLNAYPNIGLVHSKFHVIDSEGKIIKCNTNFGQDRVKDEVENRIDILTHPYGRINASTVMFRRECFEKLGGFADELCYAIDWEYWMRISIYYDVAFLACPLVKFRLHPGTATNMNWASDELKKLNEDMVAKKIIIDNHVGTLRGGRHIKRLMWKQMADRFACLMDNMINGDEKKSEARGLGLKMCKKYTELLFFKSVHKVLLKSILNRRSIDLLKSLFQC